MYNVCGLKKGKTDQIIAFGAHFDHIGETQKSDDKVFNGADDNASGVSMVIGLSDYFKNKETSSGLMFMAFNTEEMGLIGSGFLAKDSGFEKYIPKIKALLNFEMLGTKSAFGDNKVYITGHDKSDLDEIINNNAANGLQIVPDYPHFS